MQVGLVQSVTAIEFISSFLTAGMIPNYFWLTKRITQLMQCNGITVSHLHSCLT
jgi:hypothetical protein